MLKRQHTSLGRTYFRIITWFAFIHTGDAYGIFISDKTHLQNVSQRTLSILFPTRRYCFNTESLNDQSWSLTLKNEFYLFMFLCLTCQFCYLHFSNALACLDVIKKSFIEASIILYICTVCTDVYMYLM